MPEKSQATTSLVLGILGLVCCGVIAPFAWFIGKKEVDAIGEGRRPPDGHGMAKAGMILGIIGTVFLVLGIIWVVVFGGLSVLTELS